jgi:flavin-dependent dehydrogenase
MTYDALIIGGGPAGASTALLLARAGWSVAVVEKKTFPRRKVCGEFISATTLPLFEALGVGRQFFGRAGPDVRRVGLYAGETVLAADMPAPADTSARWGRALGREHLDLLLLEAARRAGAHIWQPCAAAELRRTRTGYECGIVAKNGSRILAARLLVLAHGSWDVGPLHGARRPHRPSDLLAFKAHFEDSDLPADLMPLLVFPGGYGGMVHSDAGRVSLSCCIRRDALWRCRQLHGGSAGEAVLAHIRSHCDGVRETLKRSRLNGAWLSAGPINPGIRRHYASGAFFVGNVAGEAHPIVAEGISMAIQSAWLLAQRLIARSDEAMTLRALSEIGAAYSRDWKSSFSLRLRAAAIFAHLTMRPAIAALCLPLLEQFPRILTLGAHLSGKSAQLADTGSLLCLPAATQCARPDLPRA